MGLTFALPGICPRLLPPHPPAESPGTCLGSHLLARHDHPSHKIRKRGQALLILSSVSSFPLAQRLLQALAPYPRTLYDFGQCGLVAKGAGSGAGALGLNTDFANFELLYTWAISLISRYLGVCL